MTNYENIKHMGREEMAALLAIVFTSAIGEYDPETYKDAFVEYLNFLNAEVGLTI